MAEGTASPAPGGRRPRKRRPESIQAEEDFLKAIAMAGVVLLEAGYLGSKVPHRVECAKGHVTAPTPSNVKQRGTVCGICSEESRKRRPESFEAEEKFRAILVAEKATLLEDGYLGGKVPHRVMCSKGHICTPMPNNVNHRGRLGCSVCAGNDPATAYADYLAALREAGAESLEPAWKGNGIPHKIRCRRGHISYPYPGRVKAGVGVCRTCAKRDPKETERKLRKRIAEEGVVLLDPYRNTLEEMRFVCLEGHEFAATAPNVMKVEAAICPICGVRTPDALLEAHRARVEAQGGILLADKWLGAHTPLDAMCVEGHLCSPRPSGLPSGKSICRICACRDPHVVEERFRERVTELGGVVLGPWVTIHAPVLVRCKRGHKTSPRPNYVIRGGGLCRFCKGKEWDVFYVVRDEVNGAVKVGITSGNPRGRLLTHARDGFEEVVRVHPGLPGTVASELERMILGAMDDARIKPVRGREYFPESALPVILDLVDNHPAIRGRAAS